jgi:hypothetical protein
MACADQRKSQYPPATEGCVSRLHMSCLLFHEQLQGLGKSACTTGAKNFSMPASSSAGMLHSPWLINFTGLLVFSKFSPWHFRDKPWCVAEES